MRRKAPFGTEIQQVILEKAEREREKWPPSITPQKREEKKPRERHPPKVCSKMECRPCIYRRRLTKGGLFLGPLLLPPIYSLYTSGDGGHLLLHSHSLEFIRLFFAALRDFQEWEKNLLLKRKTFFPFLLSPSLLAMFLFGVLR